MRLRASVRRVANISELAPCAERHLREYTNPSGRFAFAAYDVLGDSSSLQPVDCLAPALLGAAVSAASVIEMNRPDTPEAALWNAMRDLVADPVCAETDFIDADLDGAAVRSLASAIALGKDTPGIKAVKISKILHRKLPDFVPIIDRHVYKFHTGLTLPPSPYGKSVKRFWHVLQPDLKDNRDWLSDLASKFPTPDGRPLSVLRAADIIVWHHVTQHCTV